jgi:hypothetical protein
MHKARYLPILPCTVEHVCYVFPQLFSIIVDAEKGKKYQLVSNTDNCFPIHFGDQKQI